LAFYFQGNALFALGRLEEGLINYKKVNEKTEELLNLIFQEEIQKSEEEEKNN
jgi:hypothetical protein